MERTLHQELKSLYARDGETEVTVGEFRIDAVARGELIEIQCASLSAIKNKCGKLVQSRKLRVVKPLIRRTRIRKLDASGNKLVSLRMSPKRGHRADIFDELVYIAGLLKEPNFILEVPSIHVEQTRRPRPARKRRWGRRDYQVLDVRLESIEDKHVISQPADLWPFLGLEPPVEAFNTQQLAQRVDCSRHRAQQIAYVLRHCGAVEALGRKRDGIQYRAA
ncbi:MAG: hypothetical protein AAF958_05255 [Planctomycetota bacterium]